MHKWISALDEITAAFKQAFEGLSAEALNWKPAPDRWSIAQNLEHLIKINESYYPVVEKARKGNLKLPWLARFSFVPPLMGTLLLKAVAPESTKKTKTFAVWQPAQGQLEGDILARFIKHQEAMKVFIANNQDLVERGVLITSPAKKIIVYPLSSAFDILVAHERRHLGQAREVLALMKGRVQEKQGI